MNMNCLLMRCSPWLCALIFATFSFVAKADVVSPPPTDCPAGSTGGTGHAGTYCGPNKKCESDADCNGGTCASVSFCITKDPGCGGRPLPDGGPACFPYDKVLKVCGNPPSCTEGSCDTSKRCFPKGTNPPPPPQDAGGGQGGDKSGGTNNDDGNTGDNGLGVTKVCGCSASSLPIGSLLILLFFSGIFLRPSRRNDTR